jgi:hypothetical protein
VVAAVAALSVCENEDDPLGPELDRVVDPQLVALGKEIFRFDTFGDEVFWTDGLRVHQVISAAVSPSTALQVGLEVDLGAQPPWRRSWIAPTALGSST